MTLHDTHFESNNVDMNAHDNKSATFREASTKWGYITCKHHTRMLLVCHYDCAPSYLMFPSSPG